MNTFLTDGRARALAAGWPAQGALLLVSITDQAGACVTGLSAPLIFPVSTSRFGPGQQRDSLKTPTGWHRVAARYGAGQPVGMCFRERRATGHLCPAGAWNNSSAPDFILTRILHLEGLEPGHNRGDDVDSFERFIYLHGTNHENTLGQPASQGCIRMSNAILIDVFDRLAPYEEVWCWIG